MYETVPAIINQLQPLLRVPTIVFLTETLVEVSKCNCGSPRDIESEECFKIELALVCHASAKRIDFPEKSLRLLWVPRAGGLLRFLYQEIFVGLDGKKVRKRVGPEAIEYQGDGKIWIAIPHFLGELPAAVVKNVRTGGARRAVPVCLPFPARSQRLFCVLPRRG